MFLSSLILASKKDKDLMQEKLLGRRYRILQRIGEGGMAFVYSAIDEKLGRKVAIKILHEHMARNTEIRQRFQLEAHAASGLEHPNIVKIYDFSGADSTKLWLVTELITGYNLAHFIQKFTSGWMHPIIATCIVREVCKALEKAHCHGIVHRDIKPENIMLTNEGTIKLMDFGIAKNLQSHSMTHTGTFMGSPSYMSPEQIRGTDVDCRSDIYSLGVLYYEIITGKLPYRGNSTHEVAMKIVEGNFTPPRFIIPSTPSTVDAIICKAIAKESQDRYQKTKQMGADIDRFLSNYGFVESHVELERFFKDRSGYGLRLANILVDVSPQEKIKAQLAADSSRENTELKITRAKVNYAQKIQETLLKIDESKRRSLAPPVPIDKPDIPLPFLEPKLNPNQPIEPKPVLKHRITQLPSARKAEALTGQQALGHRFTNNQIEQRHYRVVRPYPQDIYQRRLRNLSRYPQTATTGVWSYILGIVFVGIVSILTIWGFSVLEDKLKNRPHNYQEKVDKKRSTIEPPVVNKQQIKKKSAEQPKTKKISPPTVQTKSSNEQTLAPTKPTSKVKATEKIPLLQKQKLPAQPTVKAKPEQLPDKKPMIPIPSQTKTPLPEKKQAALPSLPVPAKPVVAKKQLPDDSATKSAVDEEPLPVKEQEDKDEKPIKKEYKPAQIYLSSQPAAEIFIDGKHLGTTVDQTSGSGWINIKPGKHTLKLQRQGFLPYKDDILLSPGEQRKVGKIILQQSESCSLTLKTNQQPVKVTLFDLSKNTNDSFTLNALTKVIVLEHGKYKIKIEYQGKVIEREFSLPGPSGNMTFMAEFKEDE